MEPSKPTDDRSRLCPPLPAAVPTAFSPPH
jgi:hypothetical protein